MRVKFICRGLASLMVSLSVCGSCLAQSLGTTFTDLWWNPSESGWGVTVDHQQDVMFLTFFVYRSDGSPYWVTSLLTHPIDPSRPFFFSGDVSETHGPSFGQPFDPSLVTNRKVGTATFNATQGNAATLTYSIDGVTVTKSIQRQTLRFFDFWRVQWHCQLRAFELSQPGPQRPATRSAGTIDDPSQRSGVQDAASNFARKLRLRGYLRADRLYWSGERHAFLQRWHCRYVLDECYAVDYLWHERSNRRSSNGRLHL